MSDISKLSRAAGILLEVQRARGKGSHQGLIFTDRERQCQIPIVIGGGDVITPGVQRSMIAYFGDSDRNSRKPGASALARDVRRILETYFNS